MTRAERKRLNQTLWLGATVTALVILLDVVGVLSPLQRWLYDARARSFQFFSPEPTQEIVHLDIDDRALDVVGRWPWDRDRLAQVISELEAAGARVIVLDIWFPEPQPEHDAELEAALAKAGNVIVPSRMLLLTDPPTELEQQMTALLRTDLEATLEQVREALPPEVQETDEEALETAFLRARRRAAYDRIEPLVLDASAISYEAILAEVAPGQTPELATPLTRLVQRQIVRAQAMREMHRFSLPAEAAQTAMPANDHQLSL
ncbi:MAG: CHASE2 domain-containing protein, partial [Opitutales bacterium]